VTELKQPLAGPDVCRSSQYRPEAPLREAEKFRLEG
jgi:hypothetical protein